MSDDPSARAAAILERLREIERVCEATTPGPWLANDYHMVVQTMNPDVPLGAVVRAGNTERYVRDLAFVPVARTALPACVRIGIAEVERAQAMINPPNNTGLEWVAEEILDRWSPILEVTP